MLIYGTNWLCTDFCPVYHTCALKSIFSGFTFGVPKTKIFERKEKCRLHLKLPETVPEKTCTNGRRPSVERRKFEGHFVEGENEIHKTTKHRKTWIKTLNDNTSNGTQHQNTIRLTVKNVNIFCFVFKHRKHNKISHRKHKYLYVKNTSPGGTSTRLCCKARPGPNNLFADFNPAEFQIRIRADPYLFALTVRIRSYFYGAGSWSGLFSLFIVLNRCEIFKGHIHKHNNLTFNWLSLEIKKKVILWPFLKI